MSCVELTLTLKVPTRRAAMVETHSPAVNSCTLIRCCIKDTGTMILLSVVVQSDFFFQLFGSTHAKNDDFLLNGASFIRKGNKENQS